MIELITHTMATYAVTFLITDSHAGEPLRKYFNVLLHKIKLSSLADEKEFILIECRQCVSFWVCLFFAIVTSSPPMYFIAAYGLNWWITTKEYV